MLHITNQQIVLKANSIYTWANKLLASIIYFMVRKYTT